MRFPYRRQWLLRRMNRSLSRSDPHLAAMLAIFARLTAGEAITSKEQSTSPAPRAWRGLAWLEGAAVHAAVALFACAGRALRRVAGGCAAARRRAGAAAKAVLGVSRTRRVRPCGEAVPDCPRTDPARRRRLSGEIVRAPGCLACACHPAPRRFAGQPVPEVS